MYGLSTVTIDSLYSNLKTMMKPLDIKYSKDAFKDHENQYQ